MKKFVLVYHGGGMPENATKEEMQAVNEQWMAWFTSLHDKVVDGGNPFAPVGRSVSNKGVTNVDMTLASTGYSIINAKDMGEAVEIAKGCPLVKNTNGEVRVYEALPM